MVPAAPVTWENLYMTRVYALVTLFLSLYRARSGLHMDIRAFDKWTDGLADRATRDASAISE